MSKLLTLPLAVFTVALQAAPVIAQAGGANRVLGPAQPDAFERQYPEAAALINTYNAAFGTVLEQLYTNSASSIEGATFDQLIDRVRSGSAEPTALASSMPTVASSASQVAEALAWGNQFEQALYDIYADDRISDKSAAVDQAVADYLSRSDVAVASEPKFMMISMGGGHAGHGGMEMEDAHHSMMFRETYPKTNGLLWASQWLQIAVLDPMMYFQTPEARRRGVEDVVDRFQELTDAAPENFPSEMPTPAAVSPELVRLHPQAAAIVDNLHKLQGAVADALVHETTQDKRMMLNAALVDMQDPEHMAVSEYDWILNSLRNGIFFQGGPAIGRIETSERNRGGHGAHGDGVMPGMGGPTGAGMPEMPAPEGPAPNGQN